MGKNIKNRDGFFKSMVKYNTSDSYNKRQEQLRENPIELEGHDRLAIFISVFLVVILPTLLILGFIIFISFLVFGII